MISKRDLPHKFPEKKDFQRGAASREKEAFGNDVFGNTSSATNVIMNVT
jgi:hypothetical protein